VSEPVPEESAVDVPVSPVSGGGEVDVADAVVLADAALVLVSSPDDPTLVPAVSSLDTAPEPLATPLASKLHAATMHRSTSTLIHHESTRSNSAPRRDVCGPVGVPSKRAPRCSLDRSGRDGTTARALAMSAREGYRAAGDAEVQRRREVDGWLARRKE